MRKLTLEYVQLLAEYKGGKYLSKTYINSQAKELWQCKKGHVWKSATNNIKKGCWCPYCSGNIRKTIDNAKILAESKEGKYLSKTYTNCYKKELWKCKKGHQWFTTYDNIKNGSWCPYCSGNIKKTIEDAKNLAKLKKGKYLSKTYTNSCTKELWKCEKNHIWEASYDNIKQGK